MTVLQTEQFSVSYDGINDAVSNVTFSVEEGEIICIVGESGSGKSTMLHSFLGLLPGGAACKGSCQLFGAELGSMSEKEKRAMRGQDVSVIFQDTGRFMNPISRIGRQYTSFLRLHGIKEKKACLELEKEMLTRVHLYDTDRVLHAYPFELSGGMRQRVGIAMAMSLRPKLLLADEPTSALDVTVQAQVVSELMELRKKYGTTILMVTHNMGVAAHMADRIGVMQNGRMVEFGKTQDVIRNPQQEYTGKLLNAVVELDAPSFLKKTDCRGAEYGREHSGNKKCQ